MQEITVSDALLDAGRSWLRISSKSQDEEIRQTISACFFDLYDAGVNNIDPDNALIRQAVKLFLKGFFGYDADAERFQLAYKELRNSLALSGDFRTTEASDGSDS